MGEAKARASKSGGMIWHHTSSLRTNQMWMAGHIIPEGTMPDALHPKLGMIKTDAIRRRSMNDFPPLVWLTTRFTVPNCLLNAALVLTDVETGEVRQRFDDMGMSNAIALQRVALGFSIEETGVTRWTDHPGYSTPEGSELNASAIDVGDDPADWYVSEAPIDLMMTREVRISRRIMQPKMERSEVYLPEIHRMVQLCRETPGAFIPPSWLPIEEQKNLARQLGVGFSGG